MTNAGTFKAGERIGPYRVESLIGVGFMGEVYRAAHVETSEVVALKCLQVRHIDNADLVERARREAVALTEIRHSNIVYVHEAGVTDEGVVWMAMELLVGQSLRRLMKGGRVPVPMALHFACEIADGVDAAHELSIVHRDLKPENVFVTDGNAVRVLDLGTAKFFGQDMETTARAQVFGTVPYMSPEHLAGERVDARTDVYALGMMLYEMIAGAHPFKAHFDNVLELGRAQLFQKPRPLFEAVEGLPGYLWALVEKAIAKDRDHRYMSMSDMARAVRRARRRYEEELGRGRDEEGFDRTLPRVPSSRRDYMPPQVAPSSRGSGRESSPRVVYAPVLNGPAAPGSGQARGGFGPSGEAGRALSGGPPRAFVPSTKTLPIHFNKNEGSRGSVPSPLAASGEDSGGGSQETVGPFGTQVISPELSAAMVARSADQAAAGSSRGTPSKEAAARWANAAPGSGVHRSLPPSAVATAPALDRSEVMTADGVGIPTRSVLEGESRRKNGPAFLFGLFVALGVGMGGVVWLRWLSPAPTSTPESAAPVEDVAPAPREVLLPPRAPEAPVASAPEVEAPEPKVEASAPKIKASAPALVPAQPTPPAEKRRTAPLGSPQPVKKLAPAPQPPLPKYQPLFE
jgi:serine/threonine-protein kinase